MRIKQLLCQFFYPNSTVAQSTLPMERLHKVSKYTHQITSIITEYSAGSIGYSIASFRYVVHSYKSGSH